MVSAVPVSAVVIPPLATFKVARQLMLCHSFFSVGGPSGLHRNRRTSAINKAVVFGFATHPVFAIPVGLHTTVCDLFGGRADLLNVRKSTRAEFTHFL